MAKNCGCEENGAFDGMSKAYKRILLIIIVINFTMFIVEIIGGLSSKSTALLADSLDFLGDTATYSISLMVIGMPIATRAKAGLFKGISLFLIALWVLGVTAYRLIFMEVPEAITMGAIGIAALIANVVSVLLLLRYKDGDSNVRSVWLCSRNDAIGNLAVIVAAFGIITTKSIWPDIIVAVVMASLFSSSAYQIIKQSKDELNQKLIQDNQVTENKGNN